MMTEEVARADKTENEITDKLSGDEIIEDLRIRSEGSSLPLGSDQMRWEDDWLIAGDHPPITDHDLKKSGVGCG